MQNEIITQTKSSMPLGDGLFKFSTSVVALPMFFVLFLWISFWAEMRFHLDFSDRGIFPRTFSGLQGVFFSPFIHSNLKHLANNSLPLLVLLAALRFFYRKQSYQIIVYGILLSGILTWLIGRPNYHIGASGLIYVLISFLIFKGLQTKFYRLVALSFTIIILYGGLIWYMFPLPKINDSLSISWESHLSGFITGLIFAVIVKTPEYSKPIFYEWQNPNFNPNEDEFMRNFDENGNFIVKTIDENEGNSNELLNVLENNQCESEKTKVIYHYKESEN